ncbi:MAG TPA: ribosomal protein S18-alanine N-acetyltransferase [Gemmatimonadaceae bacterium]|nr:ribosomal protein S18-alanine N-acetyltransferase [Gemmatimonadaceae bacterium]
MATRERLIERAATIGDLDDVGEIERASFSDPWSRDAFIAALGNPNVTFLVVASGPATRAIPSRVLGYVVAWFAGGDGEIANVAVAPEARRQGVGARLMDAALAAARRRGVEQLFLEVRESNVAAQALYASRGFEPVGRRRQYYRKPTEDALVLRALLAPDPGEPALHSK